MPRIPDDYLGKLIYKINEIKKNKMNLLTTMMALVIFVVCLFEAVSFFLPDYVSSKDYKQFYFPLFCSVELFIFSLFFVFKSFRYTSCLDTKIVSVLLNFVFFISIIALVFQFTPENYLLMLQPIILTCILLISLINLIRWFSK
ncbi:hypothetical protein [Flavobacterium phage FPSV-S2]|nr:hypothetical protein [Flavobacterium phage FPSV-S2]